MLMTPRLRKLTLTAHVIFSVGWLGSVVAFLALAIAGIASDDAQLVRATYIAMDLTGWYVVLPLCLVSFLTGLVSSLGTTWGLFRQYWVLFKLLMIVPSTLMLLVHMQPITYVASIAAKTILSGADLHGLRIQLIVEAGAALVVLIVATALSVYKPKGMTRYGWRKQREQRALPQSSTATPALPKL
jgi:hypothetical protein